MSICLHSMKIQERVCCEVSERDPLITSCPRHSRSRGQASARDDLGGCWRVGISLATAPGARRGVLLTQQAAQGPPAFAPPGVSSPTVTVSSPTVTGSRQLSEVFKPHNVRPQEACGRKRALPLNLGQTPGSPEDRVCQSSPQRINLLSLEPSGGSGWIWAAQASCHVWQLRQSRSELWRA